MFSRLRSSMGRIWCRLAHRSVLWPVHGRYEYRTCGRRYSAFAEAPTGNWTGRAAFRPAVSLLLAATLALFVGSAHGADTLKRDASAEANRVLDRFLAAGESAPWAIESVEIHAALPKLDKIGQLRAIRRLASPSESSYAVLQLAGDRTVEEQVIGRYLSVNERAPAGPVAGAMTIANYRFTYTGIIDDGERLAYAFQVSPRRKREGLIKGELWLDQRTAIPVHESGRLVKSPVASVRHVFVRRENAVRDGLIESRLTHITCKARHLGLAELVVEELPITLPAGE
jgi:hypothetical protein